MPWAGRNIKSGVTKPCGGIGNSSAVPSLSAGIIRLTLLRQSYRRLPWSSRPRFRLSKSKKWPRQRKEAGEKKEPEAPERPQVSWPQALRAVRAWLEPWVLLRRYWRAWSALPPPRPLQQLLEHLHQGFPLYLYATF